MAAAALELLQRARETVPEDCAFVFPADRKAPGGDWRPIAGYQKAWGWVSAKAELAPDSEGRPARAYDLRHSFASIAAGQGMSLLLIGKLLGHGHSITTARYAHLSDDPLRAAVERIGAVIENAGKKSGNVVDLERGRGS